MATGLSRLAGEMTGATAPGNRPDCWLETGVLYQAITGYFPDPMVSVLWRGVEVPASYIASYTPNAGDVVLLLIQPPAVHVLGRLIGPEGN